MRTKEEILQLSKRAFPDNKDRAKGFIGGYNTAIYEEGMNLSEWIKITEGNNYDNLPKEEENVLLVVRNETNGKRNVIIGWYQKTPYGPSWYYETGDFYVKEPTHWMPLPKLPE